MFGETTFFYVKIWNHPTETTKKTWLFRVPGGYPYPQHSPQITQRKKKIPGSLTEIAPEKLPSGPQKERIIFQPSFFRGKLAVKLRGCIKKKTIDTKIRNTTSQHVGIFEKSPLAISTNRDLAFAVICKSNRFRMAMGRMIFYQHLPKGAIRTLRDVV